MTYYQNYQNRNGPLFEKSSLQRLAGSKMLRIGAAIAFAAATFAWLVVGGGSSLVVSPTLETNTTLSSMAVFSILAFIGWAMLGVLGPASRQGVGAPNVKRAGLSPATSRAR